MAPRQFRILLALFFSIIVLLACQNWCLYTRLRAEAAAAQASANRANTYALRARTAAREARNAAEEANSNAEAAMSRVDSRAPNAPKSRRKRQYPAIELLRDTHPLPPQIF